MAKKKKGSKKISMPLSNIGSSSMTLQKHIHRIMLMKKHQRQGLIAFLCIQSYFKCHVKGFDRHDKLVVAQVYQ